ncbi:MAG TPA: GNAT family N-acetyltransferase [Solirubrobacteraceae bacterium]|nr:GNAT family N-acetyltransferase [Solirubrobacteraceae bacterium]
MSATSPPPELRTERLLLRGWRPEDREPFAAINGDRRVMELLAGKLTRAQSDAYIEELEGHFAAYGYGLWAVERLDGGGLIGMAGLNAVGFEAHFTPAVEIGWRLAHLVWGHGYASEAARAALHFGFERGGLSEIVSMTSMPNVRSQAVMKRIGMRRDRADDFVHPFARPMFLRRHMLYRLDVEEWAARKAGIGRTNGGSGPTSLPGGPGPRSLPGDPGSTDPSGPTPADPPGDSP